MSNIAIEILGAQDLKDLCQFEVQARLTEPDIWPEGFSEHELLMRLQAANAGNLENNKILVAKQGDTIIGRCDITILLSLMDFEKTGYVDWVYVLKNHRGQGIAKKLFAAAEEFFKLKGVSQYYLFTADNEEAQHFYHRQNFKFAKKEVAEKELK